MLSGALSSISASEASGAGPVFPGVRKRAGLGSVAPAKEAHAARRLRRVDPSDQKKISKAFQGSLAHFKADVCIVAPTYHDKYTYGVVHWAGKQRLYHLPARESRRVNAWKKTLRQSLGNVSKDGTESDPCSDYQITYNLLIDGDKVYAWSKDADGKIKPLSQVDVKHQDLLGFFAGVMEDYVPAMASVKTTGVPPEGDYSMTDGGGSDVQFDMVAKDVPMTAFDNIKRVGVPKSEKVLFKLSGPSQFRVTVNPNNNRPILVRRTIKNCQPVWIAFNKFENEKPNPKNFKPPSNVERWDEAASGLTKRKGEKSTAKGAAGRSASPPTSSSSSSSAAPGGEAGGDADGSQGSGMSISSASGAPSPAMSAPSEGSEAEIVEEKKPKSAAKKSKGATSSGSKKPAASASDFGPGDSKSKDKKKADKKKTKGAGAESAPQKKGCC